MRKTIRKPYEEHASPFFRLQSQVKLAKLLRVSKSKMRALARDKRLYVDFKKPKSSGGSRAISAPRPDLKVVQKRVANLLQRISVRDYLFAPVAGRSYVDNAAVHVGSDSIHLLDIENFFPNCKARKVYWFFHTRMQCSSDVAAIVTKLVTKDGALPQGSPCSPILAYFSYIDMWEEISGLVNRADCTLSVYADDLTFSGVNVPGSLIWEIKKVIRKHGHRHSESKERSKHLKPVEITGGVVGPDGLYLPNRQHKALYDLRRKLRQTQLSEDTDELQAQLRGREAQKYQVVSHLANR